MDSAAPTPASKTLLLRKKLARLRIWGRRRSIGVTFEISLAVVAVLAAIATYIAISGGTAPFEEVTRTVRILLLVDIVVFCLLTSLIARRMISLWNAQRRGAAGSKLQGKIFWAFTLVAIGPPVIMAFFAALFFDQGLQNWFSDKVRTTLQNSLEVAEGYVAEHQQNIRADILLMAQDLNSGAALLEFNPLALNQAVNLQTRARVLSEAMVVNGNGEIRTRASFDLGLNPPTIDQASLDLATGGDVIILPQQQDDRIHAILRLENFVDSYLYVSRRVDAEVLGHVQAARTSLAEYLNLEDERSAFQITVNVVFIMVALVVLVAAMWFGILFASRLAAPISDLVDAAEKIGKGDLAARVPATNTADEIGTLSRTFNRMTGQLETQRRELILTNSELDQRRRFSEAVLSGVSAGIIGVKPDGSIHLPNLSACMLLDSRVEDLMGRPMAEAAPEFQDLMARAESSDGEAAQGQVNITRHGEDRNLLVRVSAVRDRDEITGFVVTFDDVTEQLADQRTAAWADVARRIAHEIKNPLTPIQLSAERLQRKYSQEIRSEPEVFTQCTDTIIRQVGDLRRMVNEFSSFSRMPAPVFRASDLIDIVRQAVFLQQVANSGIDFEMELPDGAVTLPCDGRLIVQALTNLIKNAVESIAASHGAGEEDGAAAQGRITVTLESDDEVTRVIIRDTGLGLPTEARERLTEPYVTTREKGTGLGLAIVKKVMEDHGGYLTLENRDETGARVAMTFPHRALRRKAHKSGEEKSEPTDSEDTRTAIHGA